MAILYNKGNATNGRLLDPKERILQRSKMNLGKGEIISTDLKDANEYLTKGYKALSTAFKTKYPNVDYGQVKERITSINPNYRPEWKDRADSFTQEMLRSSGDRFLTREESEAALRAQGLDPDTYGQHYSTVAGRLAETGVGLPYKGERESSIENWGWRSLAAPIHGTPKGEDRYLGFFD